MSKRHWWYLDPGGSLLGLALAARVFGVALPEGFRPRDIALVALIVGMGFTVPALVLENALPGGGMTEAARLGLALSLLAGPLAILLSRAGRR